MVSKEFGGSFAAPEFSKSDRLLFKLFLKAKFQTI